MGPALDLSANDRPATHSCARGRAAKTRTVGPPYSHALIEVAIGWLLSSAGRRDLRREAKYRAVVLVAGTIVTLASAPVLLAAEAVCAVNPKQAGIQRVVVAGLSYAVAVPVGCTKGGCGVILDLHGATMRASSQEVETRLRALGTSAVDRGASAPFVVIQPTAGGTPPMWKLEDADAVYAFARCAGTRLRSPPRSLVLSGFSQGARTAAQIVCAHAANIGAVALVGGGGDILADCISAITASTPAILYVHGREDLMLPPDEADDLTTALERRSDRALHLKRVGDDERRYRGGGLVVDVILHRGTSPFSGGHCVPGGGGPVGCVAGFVFGERAIDFFITHRPRAHRRSDGR